MIIFWIIYLIGFVVTYAHLRDIIKHKFPNTLGVILFKLAFACFSWIGFLAFYISTNPFNWKKFIDYL